MTITGKEMNHGEKSPQVYVKPEGITSIVSLISTYKDAQGRVPDTARQALVDISFCEKRDVPLAYSENSVPCHHPQQKGLCFIDPHHDAEGNQKIHPFG